MQEPDPLLATDELVTAPGPLGGPLQAAAAAQGLPLFPLRSVLFPGGVMGLTVTDPVFHTLLSRCMATGQAFGAICLRDVEPRKLERVGVAAIVTDLTAAGAGWRARCVGQRRFRILAKPPKGDDGVRVAAVQYLDDDVHVAPQPAQFPVVQALAKALATLRERGQNTVVEPLRWDDAGWVANRWCELLPIPLEARQRLMELTDPNSRLAIVDTFLRDKKVIG
ncbi:MAG: LON peptidase substrate-binding domain-containing protein [Rubrivivax sp.]